MNPTSHAAASLAAFFVVSTSVGAAVITFEDVVLGSPGGPEGVWNGMDGSGGLNVGGVDFPNQFTDFGGGFSAWSGFAFSNHTDTTTPGFDNQYSASTGGGHADSSTYAVGTGDGARILFNSTIIGSQAGAWFTNTTYAALSMRDGDQFAKQFTAADQDYFTLTLQGYLQGVAGNQLDFSLADFRFDNESDNFILTEWAWLGFENLGTFDEIRFSFHSSDVSVFNGDEFINTPMYFAMDTLVIPEPTTATLVLLPAIAFATRRRRRSAA